MNWDTLVPMYTVYPSWSNTNINDGLIYNSVVTISNKNVCPVGWHVPSLTEFEILSKFLGGYKSPSLLIGDTTSFKIGLNKHHRPKNYYHGEPTTFSREDMTHLWTSTRITYNVNYQCGITKTFNSQYSWCFFKKPNDLFNNNTNMPSISHRGYGFYIRCVQD
jgi:uncharacterized protein (TIGR02145 family)